MDYKEKYEAALKAAKEGKSIEEIFPEVAENEDERIRKDIIHIVETYWGNQKNIREKYVSWLEKQVELNDDKIVKKSKTEKQRVLLTETNGNAYIDWDCCSLNDVEKLLNCGLNFIHNTKENKQKMPGTRFGGCSIYIPTRYDKLEEQSEQNHTDEVKPKFKVGDWIAKQYLSSPFVIVDIKNDSYILNDIEGNKYEETIDFAHKVFHLWTIQDAEDGDVLKEDSCTFIIERMKPDETAIVHCCLFDDGDFDLIGSTLSFDVDSTYPATKEQCDLLFQKMKEAGYEWNAEKKELKNIEQKPVDKIEPKFKIGDFVVRELYNTCYQIKNCILNVTNNKYGYDLTSGGYISSQDANFYHLWTIKDAKDGDVLVTDSGRPFIFTGCLDERHPNSPVAYCGIDCTNRFYGYNGTSWWTDEDVYPATEEHCDLLFQKMKEAGYEWDAEKKELRKIEQKHAEWSEEDEKMLNSSIYFVNNYHYDEVCGDGSIFTDCFYTSKVADWLKSIKDRVQPQQKQEWSKEDSERLLRIHQFIWANRKGDTDEIYQQEQDADWLMSFNPQQNSYDKGYNDGYSAAKYNQWKPTDKQMEDFRMLLDYNIGVFDYAKFMSANSLYDDLKKNLID